MAEHRLHVVVVLFLPAYGRVGAVAGQDDGVVGQTEQLIIDAVQFCFHVAAGQVGPSDTSLEECVAAKHQPFIGTIERG